MSLGHQYNVLSSEKDKLMYERDRSTFAQNCLKVNALPIYSREQTIDTFIVGEALLLCQNKWGKGDKWGISLMVIYN